MPPQSCFSDDQDDAGARLDTYLRQVQEIVTRYGGILVDLTMADKGGYLYAEFGAPDPEALERRITAIALRQDTSVAYVTCDAAYKCGRHAVIRVWSFAAGAKEPTQVARGRRIDPKRVAIRGGRVAWWENGAQRSTLLRR